MAVRFLPPEKRSALTPQDYANLFNEMEKRANIRRRIMDGRFCKQPMGAGGDSLLEIFDDLGYVFEPSYITTTLGVTDPGHLKLKEALRVSPVTGEPEFFVLRKCKNVIWSFQHSVWENYKDEERGVKEKQAEKGKDFIDVCRYWLMDEPTFELPDDVIKTGRSKWAREPRSDYSGSYGSEDY